MSLQTKLVQTGDLDMLILTFPEVGDALPMHSHGKDDSHIIIVARGKVRVHGPTIGDAEYSAGAVIDNGDMVTHEVVGLEPNSRVVHIRKRMRGEPRNGK